MVRRCVTNCSENRGDRTFEIETQTDNNYTYIYMFINIYTHLYAYVGQVIYTYVYVYILLLRLFSCNVYGKPTRVYNPLPLIDIVKRRHYQHSIIY